MKFELHENEQILNQNASWEWGISKSWHFFFFEPESKDSTSFTSFPQSYIAMHMYALAYTLYARVYFSWAGTRTKVL